MATAQRDPRVNSVRQDIEKVVVGGRGLTTEALPAVLWAGVASAQKTANGAGPDKLIGPLRKSVVLDALSDVLDDTGENMTLEEKTSLKKIAPGIIDILVAVVSGKVPDLDAFFAPETAAARTTVLKKLCRLLPCCHGRAEPEPVPPGPVPAADPAAAHSTARTSV